MSLSRTLPRHRLHGYLALARVSNSPTVFTNVLAGAALAGSLELGLEVVLLTTAMVSFYIAGMFLNDLCDYAVDRHERRERPLPSGIVSPVEAAAVVITLFGVGSALLLPLGTTPFLSGLVLIGVIILYDLWHKTNPLSPLVMAAARALVYVTTFVAFSTQVSGELVAAGGLLALYIVGLTYLARGETGRHIAGYWPAAALFLPVLYFAFRAPQAGTLVLLGLFAGWVSYSLLLAYRNKRRNVGRAVGQLIAGVALYDGLVLAVAGTLPGMVLALAAFGATLFLQRYIRGT